MKRLYALIVAAALCIVASSVWTKPDPYWKAPCGDRTAHECFMMKMLGPSHFEPWAKIDRELSLFKFQGGRELLTPDSVTRQYKQQYAWWQSIQQVAVSAGAAFQGPGDVVSGATVWGSCARVYNAASASTATSLCDLKDATTGTVAICTLRGSSTGFVDLAGSYCVGSTTPSVACAAAAGGHCVVSKVYDQTGTGNFFSTATLAAMPTLTFSALNGLPGLTCAATCSLITPNITQAQPFSFSYISERTAAFTTVSNVLSLSAGAILSGHNNVANQLDLNCGAGPLTASATDSAFHAIQSIANGASSILVPDGAASTGAAGATGLAAVPLRLMTSNGAGTGLTGVVMEVGMWPSAFNATQYGNMNTNQHSAANGYNF